MVKKTYLLILVHPTADQSPASVNLYATTTINSYYAFPANQVCKLKKHLNKLIAIERPLSFRMDSLLNEPANASHLIRKFLISYEKPSRQNSV